MAETSNGLEGCIECLSADRVINNIKPKAAGVQSDIVCDGELWMINRYCPQRFDKRCFGGGSDGKHPGAKGFRQLKGDVTNPSGASLDRYLFDRHARSRDPLDLPTP